MPRQLWAGEILLYYSTATVKKKCRKSLANCKILNKFFAVHRSPFSLILAYSRIWLLADIALLSCVLYLCSWLYKRSNVNFTWSVVYFMTFSLISANAFCFLSLSIFSCYHDMLISEIIFFLQENQCTLFRCTVILNLYHNKAVFSFLPANFWKGSQT